MNLLPESQKLHKDFANYLKVNGYAETSCYWDRIQDFLVFCDMEKLAPQSINYDSFSKYLLLIRNKPGKGGAKNVTQGYVNNKIKAVRCFYKFLIASRDIGHEAYEQICKFKQKTPEFKLRVYITPEEFVGAISKMLDKLTVKLLHEKVVAILFFMFYTGLRKKELCELKREDINLEKLKATIRLPRKNKKEYRVFFPQEIANLLVKYFKMEEEKINAFNVNPWQIRWIIHCLNEWLPQDKHFTPHNMRHSFAMMLVENDVDIAKAMELLGQTKIETTQIYYRPTEKQIERDYHAKIKGVITRR